MEFRLHWCSPDGFVTYNRVPKTRKVAIVDGSGRRDSLKEQTFGASNRQIDHGASYLIFEQDWPDAAARLISCTILDCFLNG